MNQDISNLKTLSIFHYVLAGLNCIGIFGGVIYLFIGIFLLTVPSHIETSSRSERYSPEFEQMLSEAEQSNREEAKAAIAFGGSMMIMIAVMVIVFATIIVTLNIVAGKNLGRMKSRGLCLVTAGLNCINVPLGTILAVFTFIVLSKPSVIHLFEGQSFQKQKY